MVEEYGEKEGELLEVLQDVVWQACYVRDANRLDSMALSAYADAIRLLARYERVRIVSEHGRRVIAVGVEYVDAAAEK